MRKSSRKRLIEIASLPLLALALLAAPALAADVRDRNAGDDQLWRRTVELVRRGDFDKAAETAGKIDAEGPLTEQVRAWLDEYTESQQERAKLNAEDLDKYTNYIKQRVEREEWAEALSWVLAAKDVAEDEEKLLSSDWMQDLVNRALSAATKHREDAEWRDAWIIYARLGAAFDREPKYQKLEQEMVTHLRLDGMFEEDRSWTTVQENIERVEWNDAKKALEYLSYYYEQEPDFKRITEAGLEHLLLLTESKTAQERFDGLGDDHDRNDFRIRVKARLDQVRRAPRLDRTDCVRHFRRAVKDINRETIKLPEELVVSELMYGAFQPLDDFTTIIWPREATEFEKHTRGDFTGVGISIIKNRMDEIEVVTPIEDTPAYRAGIQAGDVIIGVDGTSIKGWSSNKVVETITGPVDTPVTLTIRRGENEIEFPLVRAKVKIQSVKGWERDDHEQWNFWADKERGIGYVRLTNFQRNTPEDLMDALAGLEAEGLNGLILDLRWDPGGLLDSAWQISSMFLKRGDPVVSTKGRIPGEDHEFFAPTDGPFADVPLVVLVNDSSASASEIVSGAIRDNKRGIVMGERTYGKFSVQNLIPLGSSRAKLKITTSKYYLPSGASLHREPTSTTWGVEPNIPVKLVDKEALRAWQLRREADRLGPPREKKDGDADQLGMIESEKKDDEAKDEKTAEADGKEAEQSGETEKVADAEEKKDELPPLDQPDENNRPREDHQVDAALLLLRVKLLAERFPTIANLSPDAQERALQPKPQ